MATEDFLTDSAAFFPTTAPNATIYSPLEQGQTRVLHLQPARKLTAPLVGVFEIIEVEGNAEYEALSYTWGQPFDERETSSDESEMSSDESEMSSDESEISADESEIYSYNNEMLDQRSYMSSIRKAERQERIFSTYQFEPGEIRIHEVAVPTTANLHVALRRLRYPDRARTLWVDAICINQDDLTERSAQVACMAQIFSRARQVVAWIGEDSVEKEGQFFLGHCRENMESRKDPLSGPSWTLYERMHKLAVFDERHYFRRRWCIQEVACAQSAMLKCGALEIPWPTFIAALHGDRSFDYGAISKLAQITEQENTIKLMISLSPWECLDKRDFIYSVASILRLRPDCPQITIDYNLDWPTVYTRFTRDYIQLNGYFAAWNILVAAGFQYSRPLPIRRFPSETHTWVPDWSACQLGDDYSMCLSLLGDQDYVKDDNHKIICDDHSIKIDLLCLGQVDINENSGDGVLCSDFYYRLFAEYKPGERYATLILRRCGEQDMTFQLVGCIELMHAEWPTELEVHRVTII